MENINKVVSRNLIKFRLLSGLTQRELAKKINYSDKSISKWERGENLPDLAVLVKLSEIYGVDINAFLNEKTEEQELEINSDYLNKKHFMIAILSAGLVWFIATIVFVVLFMNKSTERIAWLSFIYAIPLSSIVLLVFSKLWGNNILSTICSSFILWGVIISVCLTIRIKKAWNICFIGLMLEVLLIIWCVFISKFRKKSKKVD